ncbi:hypothetical protein AWENTII_009609 [Aspergillus wentii]
MHFPFLLAESTGSDPIVVPGNLVCHGFSLILFVMDSPRLNLFTKVIQQRYNQYTCFEGIYQVIESRNAHTPTHDQQKYPEAERKKTISNRTSPLRVYQTVIQSKQKDGALIHHPMPEMG